MNTINPIIFNINNFQVNKKNIEMSLRIAGVFLMAIGGLFMYEIYLINETTNNFNMNFLSESEKVIKQLKICGAIQILLLTFAGILIAVSDDSDEISEIKKRIAKLENKS